MPVKDVFSYSARWGSVGLDCTNCIYCRSPSSWPDKNRELACSLHNVSLALEIDNNGYKEGEWFCKNFMNNGTANRKALIEFEQLVSNLSEDILYRPSYLNDMLDEYDIQNLKNKTYVE